MGGWRRKDVAIIPQGASTASQAMLLDAGLGDDDEEGGTSWADVFGNITSALAPAIGVAAGMYTSSALKKTAAKTGQPIPRGTMVMGPNGQMIPYQGPSMLSSMSPYLLPLAGLAAILLLTRKK